MYRHKIRHARGNSMREGIRYFFKGVEEMGARRMTDRHSRKDIHAINTQLYNASSNLKQIHSTIIYPASSPMRALRLRKEHDA